MASTPKATPLRQKVKKWRQINREAGNAIVEAFFQKLALVYQRPKAVFAYALETVFVFLIALGLVIYFDPNVNLIPAPLNVILFIFIVLVYLYVHFILHLPTDRHA